jgi:hypothetical protein
VRAGPKPYTLNAIAIAGNRMDVTCCLVVAAAINATLLMLVLTKIERLSRRVEESEEALAHVSRQQQEALAMGADAARNQTRMMARMHESIRARTDEVFDRLLRLRHGMLQMEGKFGALAEKWDAPAAASHQELMQRSIPRSSAAPALRDCLPPSKPTPKTTEISSSQRVHQFAIKTVAPVVEPEARSIYVEANYGAPNTPLPMASGRRHSTRKHSTPVRVPDGNDLVNRDRTDSRRLQASTSSGDLVNVVPLHGAGCTQNSSKHSQSLSTLPLTHNLWST